MNCEFMIRLSMKLFESLLHSFMHDYYSLVFLLRSIDLVWPTRLIYLAMGRGVLWWVRSCGAQSQWQKGTWHVCIVAIKGKNMGFIHAWVYFVYIMSSCLRRYSVLYGLNTLDACWIAVDVWSNSSRCRQESVYLNWTWCLYTWSLPWISSWLFAFLSIAQQ